MTALSVQGDRPATVTRSDFVAHFVTNADVRASEENRGYCRYLTERRTGRRLEYVPGVAESLWDLLLGKLHGAPEQRLVQMDATGIDSSPQPDVARRRAVRHGTEHATGPQ
jgi:hypothetical protein